MASFQNTRPYTTTIYVDDYQIDPLRDGTQSTTSVWQEADALKAFAMEFGDAVQLHALVNRHSHHSLTAYSKADYHLHVMNGDRPEELRNLAEQARNQRFPNRLIVVSDDPAFVALCVVAAEVGVEVIIISPTNYPPPLLVENGFAIRPLTSITAGHAAPRKALAFLDVENLLYKKQRPRKHCYPQLNLKSIEHALETIDNIVATAAFGDFNELGTYFGRDVRASLERRHITTQQMDNMHGKNSADMAIAGAIYTALEQDPELTTIVIASGDRDFCPVVDRAQALGKEVILIAQPDALSQRLARKANRVIYLQ